MDFETIVWLIIIGSFILLAIGGFFISRKEKEIKSRSATKDSIGNYQGEIIDAADKKELDDYEKKVTGILIIPTIIAGIAGFLEYGLPEMEKKFFTKKPIRNSILSLIASTFVAFASIFNLGTPPDKKGLHTFCYLSLGVVAYLAGLNYGIDGLRSGDEEAMNFSKISLGLLVLETIGLLAYVLYFALRSVVKKE